MNVRSVIAVLGGTVIIYFLSSILEGPLVGMVAAERPTNMEELIAARNEPAVLLGRLAISGVVGVLAGYLTAKIADEHELLHAAAAAVLQGFLFLSAFAADPAPVAVPIAMRAAFVLVTAAAMLAGAAVRARARQAAPPTEVKS